MPWYAIFLSPGTYIAISSSNVSFLINCFSFYDFFNHVGKITLFLVIVHDDCYHYHHWQNNFQNKICSRFFRLCPLKILSEDSGLSLLYYFLVFFYLLFSFFVFFFSIFLLFSLLYSILTFCFLESSNFSKNFFFYFQIFDIRF